MTKRGSQIREPYNEAGYIISSTWPDCDRGNIVLTDIETGKKELWTINNNYSGYVITINDIGYEFLRSLN